jgi:hypothetical protein
MTTLLAIPVRPSVPHQTMRVHLDGRDFGLRFRWSQREERWYFDVSDASDGLIVGSLKVVANYPLLASSRGSGLAIPDGELFAVDRRSAPADPTLENFGDVVEFCYAQAETVEALIAELEAA